MSIGQASRILSDNLGKMTFLLVTLTMYHLYLGLAYVNQKKTMDEVRLKQKHAKWLFYPFFVSIVGFTIARLAYFNGI